MVSELEKLVRENKTYRSVAEKLKSDKLKLESQNRAFKRQLRELQEELEIYRKMHGVLPISERRRLERRFRK